MRGSIYKAQCHVITHKISIPQNKGDLVTQIFVLISSTMYIVHVLKGFVHFSSMCGTHGTHTTHITILLAHDPLSSLAYPMITHGPPVACNLPIKTLVAKQQPTNVYNIHHTSHTVCIVTYTTLYVPSYQRQLRWA